MKYSYRPAGESLSFISSSSEHPNFMRKPISLDIHTRTSPLGLVGAEGMRKQPSTFPDTISELQEPQNSDSRDRDFWHFACRTQQSRPCATHFPCEAAHKNQILGGSIRCHSPIFFEGPYPPSQNPSRASNSH